MELQSNHVTALISQLRRIGVHAALVTGPSVLSPLCPDDLRPHRPTGISPSCLNVTKSITRVTQAPVIGTCLLMVMESPEAVS